MGKTIRQAYYYVCPGCGRTFGLGKGFRGLARHGCDRDSILVERLSAQGVTSAQMSVAFERTEPQVAELYAGSRATWKVPK